MMFHRETSECDADNCTLNCQSTKLIKRKDVNFSYHNNVYIVHVYIVHVYIVHDIKKLLSRKLLDSATNPTGDSAFRSSTENNRPLVITTDANGDSSAKNNLDDKRPKPAM